MVLNVMFIGTSLSGGIHMEAGSCQELLYGLFDATWDTTLYFANAILTT